MKFSIVTTLYQSEKHIDEFYQRIKKAVLNITSNHEIIFVDDGSLDASSQKVKKICERDPCVKLAKLSKNFGHHKAMMFGIKMAQGDFVFVIDSDLEEKPELILDFHKKLIDSQSDVVYGIQETRKGNLIERLTGSFFYTLFSFLSSTKVPKNILTVRLLNRKSVDAIKQYNEKTVYMHGIWADIGLKQIPFVVHKTDKGSSTYTLKRKIKLTVDAITSFSDRPLYAISFTGMTITLFSIIFIAALIIKKLEGVSVSGWTSVIASIWFFGGVITFFLGIVGLYIARLFIEIKDRPYVLIDEAINFNTIEDKSSKSQENLLRNKQDKKISMLD